VNKHLYLYHSLVLSSPMVLLVHSKSNMISYTGVPGGM